MKAVAISTTMPLPHMVEMGIKTPEELLVYVARVSNPQNQLNTETGAGLIKYCIRNRHWSVFETNSVTMEIEVPRDIGRQILRHRSFVFQELCLSGDSVVTCVLPNGTPFKRKLSKLYERRKRGLSIPSYVRVYDENKKEFVKARLKDVYDTGIKDLYEVTLESGHKIKTTKEHKFLTQSGFLTLEEAIKLKRHNNVVSYDKSVFLATNGTPTYRSKEWLQEAKNQSIGKGGLEYIAKLAGVSIHTIRKWLKIHGLQYTKKEVALSFPSWNTGLRYNTTKPVSDETRKKQSQMARKGPASNLWKGGVCRKERSKIQDYIYKYKTTILKKFRYVCQDCENIGGKLHLHHVKPVYSHPHLAYDIENIVPLCETCHRKTHKISGDTKVWRQRSKGNTLTVKWSTVKSIKYIGEEQTYDLEVEHDSHNYVANGIVVHNSQRYTDPRQAAGFETREARLQDTKNRQNSIDTDDDELRIQWTNRQLDVINTANDAYQWAIDNGIAKECARVVLPEGNTMSRMYVTGALRNWITYIALREKSGTQKEHAEIAKLCKAEIISLFPVIAAALGDLEAPWVI